MASTKPVSPSLSNSFNGTTCSQVELVANIPLANAGDARDMGSIPRLRRSPGEGNGNPLQNSCLGNPMDREAWWVTVHEVTKTQT